MISDFIVDNKPSIFKILDIPSNDFRVDVSFRSLPTKN